MGKVKRNTASNRYREGVGAASLYDSKRDKWRMNCTRQGIPNQLKRCIVDGIKGVEAHFDVLEKYLKDHGRSRAKLLNNFDLDDLAIANRSIKIFFDLLMTPDPSVKGLESLVLKDPKGSPKVRGKEWRNCPHKESSKLKEFWRLAGGEFPLNHDSDRAFFNR